MKNFYTQNGWEGSNYDSNLKTKDIAAKVREYARKKYPEFKFSVRSGWSTYTGTITISLTGGKCYPFVEGSRSAERGYMRTMSTIGGFEKDLTPEVFEALDDITAYANSFRYNDSDGMIDYFDTNFFLHIEIEEGYKLIEPKTRKQNEAKAVEPASIEGVEIVDYSEKAIAIFGNTKEIKKQLKELGGKFNPALKYEGGKRAGWIFSKKQADKVRALLAPSTNTNEEGQTKIENINTVATSIKYDLVGKLVDNTGLTRDTIIKILQGIEKTVFDQFKSNPEEFIIKASNLINEQKATLIVQHISYTRIDGDNVYDTSIFTEPTLKGKFGINTIATAKNIYDHLLYDSTIEKDFAEKLEQAQDVVVYVKLPKGFYISTPVGKYNPDWAIAFNQEHIKHIYFVAETKGNMSSLELRDIEKAKIECAKKHFKSISNNEVKYDVISNYGELMAKVMGE